MKPAAVLIPMSRRVASCYMDPAFELLGGISIIRRLMLRLQKGMKDLEALFVILVPAEDDGLKLKCSREARGTRFQVVAATGVTPLDWFAEFALKHPYCETLAVYSELAAFPDVLTSLDMLDEHWRTGAHVTTAPRTPKGLLPSILEAALIRQLAEMDLPSECSADVLGLLQTANRLFPDNPEFRFRIHSYDAHKRRGLALAALPSNVLINDKHRREAAERVITRAESCLSLDSSNAELFKQELLEITKGCAGLASTAGCVPQVSIPWPILFASYVQAFSGAEASWAQLVSHLDRSRFRPMVLLPNPSALSAFLLDSDVEVEFAEWDFTRPSPLNFAYFSGLIRDREIALVDINCNAGLPILVTARDMGVPVVTHVRVYDAAVQQDLLQFSDLIVTVSQSVRDDVLRCEIEPNRVITVYNGVDLNTFQPGVVSRWKARQCLGLSPEADVVAIVARIDPSKRYELFLSAVAGLRKERREVMALCVGEAYPHQHAYFEKMKALSRAAGLEDAVHWTGFMLDLRRVYAASDVLVVCNPAEPMPRCAIEACAMGLPTIAPRSGGSPEIVRHGHNGLLFDPDDCQGLVHALTTYFADRELRDTLRRGALTTAQGFAIERNVSAMAAIFERLANAGSVGVNQAAGSPELTALHG